MSYSNRPGHRPDPSVAPVVYVNGKPQTRGPFAPSAYRESRENARVEARKNNRKR